MATVSICHLCQIRQRRQRFAETFGVGVFLGGFPKTSKRFGGFDIPKSIGFVWWSLPLPVGERFPGAPVTLHPSGGDLRQTILDCETSFRIHAMGEVR
jgi:hypothetical protein